MSCEDQALAPTDHCTLWPCNKAKLVKRGPYWICPACGSSYGKDAKKGLAAYQKEERRRSRGARGR